LGARTYTGYKSWIPRPLFWLGWLPSVPISILVEFLTTWETPGRSIARYVLQPDGLRFIGPVFFTSLVIDSFLCTGIIWGLFILANVWNQAQVDAVNERWPNSQRLKAVAGAMLCSFPLSYYAMLVVAVLFNRGYLPQSTWRFIGVLGICFAACVTLIYGCCAIAVRYQLRHANR
jgi:hypothetical protein